MQPGPDLRSILRENLRLRIGIAAVALVVAAVLIVAADRASRPWAQLIDGVEVALFAAALVGLIYEVWLRNTATAEVLEMVGLSSQMLRGGIREVAKYTDIQWRAFFEEHGGDIDIFVTYGGHSPDRKPSRSPESPRQEDTYQLVSQAARSRIANVCDANYTVVAKVPKQFLPKDIPWMNGVHQKMRARAKAVMASRTAR